MIISRTPFRVSFFGGGTDFPEFYNEHGGATLSTTINQYCYLTIHRLAPFFKHHYKVSYANTESVLKVQEIKHPLVRECLLLLNIGDSLEISHVADMPGRTGLGSSSSFTVGLLNALHAFRGDRVTPETLAREAIKIERERVGDPGGHQDQYAAAYGGFIRLDYSKNDYVSVKKIPLTVERQSEIQNHLLMFYTGMEQSADHILAEQRKRVRTNVSSLKEMLQFVDEAEKILIGAKDLKEFGLLLHQSWVRKKGLSPGISNDLVDQAYQAALDSGALGGKLLGAGGRGFLLLFAPAERHALIREKLGKLQEVRVAFSADGSRIIFHNGDWA